MYFFIFLNITLTLYAVNWGALAVCAAGWYAWFFQRSLQLTPVGQPLPRSVMLPYRLFELIYETSSWWPEDLHHGVVDQVVNASVAVAAIRPFDFVS